MVPPSSYNTQYLDHLKSTSVSPLIKGKSRDLQKLLRCLSGILWTSVFKGGIGGCSDCGG